MHSAGEIILVERAIEQAGLESIPFSHELSLYIVHGWLHLAGYTDDNAEAILKMRAAENACMNLLQQAGKLNAFHIKHATPIDWWPPRKIKSIKIKVIHP